MLQQILMQGYHFAHPSLLSRRFANPNIISIDVPEVCKRAYSVLLNEIIISPEIALNRR